jgi:hypothetical protein
MRWPGVTCVIVHAHPTDAGQRSLADAINLRCSGTTLWLVLVPNTRLQILCAVANDGYGTLL